MESKNKKGNHLNNIISKNKENLILNIPYNEENIFFEYCG